MDKIICNLIQVDIPVIRRKRTKVFQAQVAVQKQPQTAEEQPEQKRSYTVESGDSLGFISRKFYGDSSGIQKIMEANGLANADMIFEGQTLLIP